MNSNLSLAIPFQNWQCCVRSTGCLLARLGGWVETSPTFAGANVRSLAVTYVGYGFYTGWYGEFQQKGGTENFKNWGGTEKGLFRTRNKPFSVYPTRLCWVLHKINFYHHWDRHWE